MFGGHCNYSMIAPMRYRRNVNALSGDPKS